jgi:glycosyltransferase involved in cell wall biosynthesis
MRIGVLTHNYPRFRGDFVGGFIEASCRELARQGHHVTAIAPYDPAFDRPLSESVGLGTVDLRLYRYAWPPQLHRVGYGRSMRSDLALRFDGYILSPAMITSGIIATLRWARHAAPDVLHAHWVLPNGFIGAVVSRLTAIPLVVSVPGSDAQLARANALFGLMARVAFRRASLITANSADLRDAVVSVGADPAKFDMIVYGTDPDRLRPDRAGVDQLRQSLGVKADDVMVLAVGRMVPKKGFDILLRSMAEQALRSRPVVVVLVGEGDERPAWQALGRGLGIDDRVRWVGSVPSDHIGEYYNAADILAMPAVTEPADGLNVCVLDAMSCGKPVVGSNVAGNPLAIDDGVTGTIVPERSPTTLATALAALADNPDLRRRMGNAGRRRIDEELGWPAVTRRYIAHFESLARGPRSSIPEPGG